MKNDKQDSIVKKETAAIIKHRETEREIAPPFADLFETASEFVLKLDLPGVRKDGIGLKIGSDVLSIEANADSVFDNYVNVVYSEIGRKKYFREFRIGYGIDSNNISAGFQNGVLTIKLPKTDEAKAKEIKIN
jgi:HSP20 family protein